MANLENNTIVHKKTLSIGKIIVYFIFMQFVLLVIGRLIFLTRTISPFTENFKNEWNKNYISGNVDYIKSEIQKYSIDISKVNKCDTNGFYEKDSLLYFCDNFTIYIFKVPHDINDLINKKQDTIIQYLIYVTILNIITLSLLGITNKSLFTKGGGIQSLNSGVRELEETLDEIEEYIDKTGNRIEYRIGTLESLALSVISEDVDFFNRYNARLNLLKEKALSKNMIYIYNVLHILYKELEKKYFIKKGKYIHALISEISLIFTKYNTSILGFVISIFFLIITSSFILQSLYQISGINLSFYNSFEYIIKIFTLKDINLVIYNSYQRGYIIFLQLLSYITFLTAIKLIVNKK